MKSNISQIRDGKEDISPPSVLSFVVLCYSLSTLHVSSLFFEDFHVIKIN